MTGAALPLARRRSAYARRRGRSGLTFVTPFMIVFTLFMVVPLAYAIYQSLYTTKLIGGTTFSGFANYATVLRSGPFWGGVARVIIFGAIQIPIMLAIAFFFATIFDLGVARWGRVFRAIFFVPFAVPIVVSSLMWGFLFDPSYGPFNRIMNTAGFHNFNWLSSGLMIPAIIIIAIWEWTGYNSIILYTALKSVPRDVIEAAILDDTPLWKIILRIKLPLVRPAIVMLVFINTIGALQLFVEPYILNNYQAGVVTNTWTPVIDIYSTAISNGEYQLGAAMAVVLAFVIIAISVTSLTFRNRRRDFG
ncbi:MAG TPA: sugar ABC transporter permease [Streptosporangiaceae bacterium]|jgi:multiple sugar transport system permease protein|nr:sugar ABC transporter permease [Streptosporangiaceae bacterium]